MARNSTPRATGATAIKATAAVGRIVVGAVLLASLAEKLTTFLSTAAGVWSGPGAFAIVMQRHGLVPPSLVLPVAYLLFIIEFVTAIWLLSHISARRAAICGAFLLAAFSAYLLAVLLLKGDQQCGCFGAVRNDTVLHAFVRNGALILALAPSCWATRSTPPLTG